MQEIIKVNQNEQGEAWVSARELYKGLEVNRRFSLWFDANSKNFVEGTDFTSVLTSTVVNNGAPRQIQDYWLTIDAAKMIAMMSATPKGNEIRRYFIQLEKEWMAQRSIPMTTEEKMAVIAKSSLKMKETVDETVRRVDYLEKIQPVSQGDYNHIGKRVGKRVNELARSLNIKTREQRSKLYEDINGGIKKITGAGCRSNIRKKDIEAVNRFITDWEPSTATKTIIDSMGGEQHA